MKNFLQIVDALLEHALLEHSGDEKDSPVFKLFSTMYAERAIKGEFDKFHSEVLCGASGISFENKSELTFNEYENALNKCTDSHVLNLAMNLRQIVESDVNRFCEIRRVDPNEAQTTGDIVEINDLNKPDDSRKAIAYFDEQIPEYYLARVVITDCF